MARPHVLKVRLSEREKRTLDREADKQGVPVAELVRDWIKSMGKRK